MSEVIIRNYWPKDELAVQEITYRTGFKGEDLTGRAYFDDKRLFFFFFIYYYTQFEPEHFFVAEDTGTGKVVGFIGGTTDTAAQQKNFQRTMVWRIGLRAYLFTSWRYPRTFKTLMGMRKMRSDFEQEDEAVAAFRSEYPAHLHIDLLPEYQSRGIGTRLIAHFEAHLIGLSVPGVHLRTTSRNLKAVPFYKKMGYTVINETQVTAHHLFDDLKTYTFAKNL